MTADARAFVAEIEDAMAGRGNSFRANLLRLIAKADSRNLAKLRRAFPEEVDAVHLYQAGQP